MLGLDAYLIGIAALALLATSAWLGATALRVRLVPEFDGAPALLATTVLAVSLVIWPAELLGTVGLFDPLPYLAVVAVVGVGLWRLLPRVAPVEAPRVVLSPGAGGPAGKGFPDPPPSAPP